MSECSERRGQNGLHTFQLSTSVPFDEQQIYDPVVIRNKEWELDQIDNKIKNVKSSKLKKNKCFAHLTKGCIKLIFFFALNCLGMPLRF